MGDNDNKLPVTTAVTVAKKTVAAPPSSSWESGAVRLVSRWAILAACCITLGRAVDWILYSCFHVHCDPSSIVLRCVYLTDAEAAEKAALWIWILCCAALQAAAAVLALLLPSRRHRIRYGLAIVALAAAILGHCMYATAVRLVLKADPGYLFYRISCTVTICIFAVGDLVSFIKLLLGGEQEEEDEEEE